MEYDFSATPFRWQVLEYRPMTTGTGSIDLQLMLHDQLGTEILSTNHTAARSVIGGDSSQVTPPFPPG